MVNSSGTDLVIPGHAAGMSPEPITAGFGRQSCCDAVLSAGPAVMGSGLFAARIPGMTAMVPSLREEGQEC